VRRVARLVLGLGVLGLGAELYLGWKASDSAIHPPREGAPWSLSDYPQLQAQRFELRSRTGVRLVGRFFAGRRPATIVLTHGYGADQDELLPSAAALHDAGFSVATYDGRGSGASEGEITFGTLEQDDLRSVVDHVAGRDDVDPQRIGAFGFSMGGATTILAAARDERIKAVAADSAWADARDWLRPSVTAMVLHPRDRFSWLSLKLVELRTATRLGDLKPAREIHRLGSRPLLLIHGEADTVVPVRDAELNLAAARGPKQLVRVPGAAHGDTIRPGGAAAGDRLTAFFEQALGR
jgi:dipeptidyl aminopeptidase/acylaminoacyl peptidase